MTFDPDQPQPPSERDLILTHLAGWLAKAKDPPKPVDEPRKDPA